MNERQITALKAIAEQPKMEIADFDKRTINALERRKYIQIMSKGVAAKATKAGKKALSELN